MTSAAADRRRHLDRVSHSALATLGTLGSIAIESQVTKNRTFKDELQQLTDPGLQNMGAGAASLIGILANTFADCTINW